MKLDTLLEILIIATIALILYMGLETVEISNKYQFKTYDIDTIEVAHYNWNTNKWEKVNQNIDTRIDSISCYQVGDSVNLIVLGDTSNYKLE